MNRTEHLLSILAEECNEVAQRVSKALRFGLEEVQPGHDASNADRINIELHDLLAVVEMLQGAGALRVPTSIEKRALRRAKRAKVEKFLAYSASLGTLTPPSPSEGEPT